MAPMAIPAMMLGFSPPSVSPFSSRDGVSDSSLFDSWLSSVTPLFAEVVVAFNAVLS